MQPTNLVTPLAPTQWGGGPMNLTQAELNAALDKSCSMTSQKGGVAKTTTTAQYAKFLANVGMKVLVVDADTNRSMTVLTGTGPTAENPRVDRRPDQIPDRAQHHRSGSAPGD